MPEGASEFSIQGISFNLFGREFVFTETMFVAILISLGLIIFACIVRYKLSHFKDVPESKFQNIVELIVESIQNLTTSTMGASNINFAPYFLTLFAFIMFCNLIGLIGFRNPTADINTTVGLAILTFLLIHVNGIRKRGLGYFKGFLEPFPLLLPLNLIGEIATPISLSFRLYGNILAGLVIMGLYYSLLPWFVKIGIPSFLNIYFDLFSGILQSLIFVMLSMVFISNAMEE